ncbi:MAG: GTPase HflX [Gemmatimonadales bacterium]
MERAILVAAPRKGSLDAKQMQEHLDELAELVDTAGAQVVGRLTQQVEAPNPATLLGEGKVAELKGRVTDERATLAVFDEELTPVQGTNLERELGVRVMDRAEVILDIFSTRARTAEAKLQVELAQLEYLLPRLTRMWTHLSRIRGGIGLRGPGETQLETDRRMIRRKIRHHRGKLQEVARHRATLRTGATRKPMLHAAIVGYTNAGKSSLLQALAGNGARDIVIEDRLFATLDTLTREAELGEGLRARVTDTVGFIRKLPHHLVASFRATLEEAREADVLLQVIDASHPDWEEQVKVVNGVLAELDLADPTEILVFNQMDRLADPAGFRARIARLYPGAVFTSAVTPGGVDELKAALREQSRAGQATLSVVIPPGEGARLAAIYRLGEVLDREETPEGTRLTVRMEDWRARQLSLIDGPGRGQE